MDKHGDGICEFIKLVEETKRNKRKKSVDRGFWFCYTDYDAGYNN